MTAIALLAGGPAASVSGAEAPPSAVARVALADGPSRIDGRLDEAAWARAEPIGPPHPERAEKEGAPPSEATEIRVLRDEHNLYLGVRCFDRDPSGIAATKIGRDAELEGDDHVLVVLDTFADRRNGFFFAVNPRGARAEGQIANNGEELNFDWDGIWDAAARVDGEGWTAELAVPFKTLRFKTDLAAWGLNVQRYVARRQETDRWTAARRDVWISNLSEAGRLEGLDGARQGRGSTSAPTSRGARRTARASGRSGATSSRTSRRT